MYCAVTVQYYTILHITLLYCTTRTAVWDVLLAVPNLTSRPCRPGSRRPSTTPRRRSCWWTASSPTRPSPSTPPLPPGMTWPPSGRQTGGGWQIQGSFKLEPLEPAGPDNLFSHRHFSLSNTKNPYVRLSVGLSVRLSTRLSVRLSLCPFWLSRSVMPLSFGCIFSHELL